MNEWVSSLLLWGASVLRGSVHPWGFEEPPHKGSTPEGRSGRLGIGPRKLLNPRGMGGCPEAQLEAKLPWPPEVDLPSMAE